MSTRIGAWKLRSTLSGGENFVAITCDACRNSMTTAEPTAVFTHCGHRDTIPLDMQDVLLGRARPGDMTAGEQSAAANLVAAERAAQAAKPVYFNESATWEAVAAQVKFDAEQNYIRKAELEDAAHRGPQIPRQSTGPREFYPVDPFTKDC